MAKARLVFDIDIDALRSAVISGAKFQRLGTSLAITLIVGSTSKWDRDTLDAFGIKLVSSALLKPEKKHGVFKKGSAGKLP